MISTQYASPSSMRMSRPDVRARSSGGSGPGSCYLRAFVSSCSPPHLEWDGPMLTESSERPSGGDWRGTCEDRVTGQHPGCRRPLFRSRRPLDRLQDVTRQRTCLMTRPRGGPYGEDLPIGSQFLSLGTVDTPEYPCNHADVRRWYGT